MILPILAPLLATLATNGLGIVADAVTKKGQQFVEDKLGVDLSQDPTPEVVAQWREAAMKHERDLLQMLYADRADARAMQVAALNQSDLFAKRFAYYLASFWSVAAVIYIALITFWTIPESNIRFADTVLGFLLGTIIATVIQYFFGSSSGSAAKQEEIREVLRGKL